MDLKIFKSLESYDAKDLKKKISAYDFYEQEKEDVTIFHSNLIKDDVFHIVFQIDEELTTKSKYVSSINKMPINIYINTFLFVSRNILCIENIYTEYYQLIIDKIYNLLGVKFGKYIFSQSSYINIIENKSNKILQYDVDIDDCIYSYENINDIKKSIEMNETLYYANITPKIEKYKDVSISVKKSGEINIKANIPYILIELMEYILGDL